MQQFFRRLESLIKLVKIIIHNFTVEKFTDMMTFKKVEIRIKSIITMICTAQSNGKHGDEM